MKHNGEALNSSRPPATPKPFG